MVDAGKAIEASHGLLGALESVRVKANEAMRDKSITTDIHRLVMMNIRDMYGAIKSHALYQEVVHQRQGGNFYSGQI